MNRFSKALRRLFGFDLPSPEEEARLRAEFKSRYHHFRQLLIHDREVHESMVDIEEALRGNDPFDMRFVRRTVTSAGTATYQVVRHLSALAPGRYDTLQERLKTIQANIHPHIAPPRKPGEGPLSIPLSELTREHTDLAGPKMSYLGEAADRLSLTIPDGFVVTAEAYRRFMAHEGLGDEILRRIQSADVEGADNPEEALFGLSSSLQQLIVSTTPPPDVAEAILSGMDEMAASGDRLRVAMRSSALGEDAEGASFAGQYESRLGVSRDEALVSYATVVASKYNRQAMSYRMRKGIREEDVAMCVGVMRMVEAQAGGVAYSGGALNPQDDTVSVFSTFGLPKTVVDGAADVDTFRFARGEPPRLVESIIVRKEAHCVCREDEGTCRMDVEEELCEQPSLSETQAREVARVALKLEAYFGVTQDLEWALSPSGTVVLLQSRALPRPPEDDFDDLPEEDTENWDYPEDSDFLPQDHGPEPEDNGPKAEETADAQAATPPADSSVSSGEAAMPSGEAAVSSDKTMKDDTPPAPKTSPEDGAPAANAAAAKKRGGEAAKTAEGPAPSESAEAAPEQGEAPAAQSPSAASSGSASESASESSSGSSSGSSSESSSENAATVSSGSSQAEPPHAGPPHAESSGETPGDMPPPLLSGGVTASPGKAFGTVFKARTKADLLLFPEGGILVVRQALPSWAPLIHRAAGVVSEMGTVAGHLASIAREFGVPAVFGLKGVMDEPDGPATDDSGRDHSDADGTGGNASGNNDTSGKGPGGNGLDAKDLNANNPDAQNVKTENQAASEPDIKAPDAKDPDAKDPDAKDSGESGPKDTPERQGANVLQNGAEVTLDADSQTLYPGRVEQLLAHRPRKRSALRGTPVHNALTNASRHVLPLNLLDPDSGDFRQQNCRTLHDILRFCHERAVREMFSFWQGKRFPRATAKQLFHNGPKQFWVLDLDDGFAHEVEGKFIRLEEIVSIPMLALWEGMNHQPWQGPPPINASGFLSVMFQATANTALEPSMATHYTQKNYFMVSRNFTSLQSRFGFHFCGAEALVGERSAENYAGFQFRGGAADRNRRVLRAHLVAELLQERDFRIRLHGDSMSARVEGFDVGEMQKRLRVLGYLIMHTRQLDMIMANRAEAERKRQQLSRELDEMLSMTG